MLVEQHSRGVFRLAYRLTGNQHDAEEAVQETFMRVFRRLDSFAESSRFETWLYRVASNASMDVIRRRQRHHTRQAPLETASGDPRPLAAATPSPDRLTQSGEITDRVAAAMQRLTPGERDAELAARESLGQLFGDSAAETTTDSEDPAASATAALFKK